MYVCVSVCVSHIRKTLDSGNFPDIPKHLVWLQYAIFAIIVYFLVNTQFSRYFQSFFFSVKSTFRCTNRKYWPECEGKKKPLKTELNSAGLQLVEFTLQFTQFICCQYYVVFFYCYFFLFNSNPFWVNERKKQSSSCIWADVSMPVCQSFFFDMDYHCNCFDFARGFFRCMLHLAYIFSYSQQFSCIFFHLYYISIYIRSNTHAMCIEMFLFSWSCAPDALSILV